MYGIHDTIVYGTQGICTIVDKIQQKVGATRMEYFVLRPIYDANATILVPVDNQTLLDKMRPCITAEDTEKIIDIMADGDSSWETDDALRREKFSATTASGDACRLAELVTQLHAHGCRQKLIGKNIHAADEKVQKEAERMLFEEVAYALGISPKEVLPYLVKCIEKRQQTQK